MLVLESVSMFLSHSAKGLSSFTNPFTTDVTFSSRNLRNAHKQIFQYAQLLLSKKGGALRLWLVRVKAFT